MPTSRPTPSAQVRAPELAEVEHHAEADHAHASSDEQVARAEAEAVAERDPDVDAGTAAPPASPKNAMYQVIVRDVGELREHAPRRRNAGVEQRCAAKISSASTTGATPSRTAARLAVRRARRAAGRRRSSAPMTSRRMPCSCSVSGRAARRARSRATIALGAAGRFAISAVACRRGGSRHSFWISQHFLLHADEGVDQARIEMPAALRARGTRTPARSARPSCRAAPR